MQLANTFLTSTRTIGMQWQHTRGDKVLKQLTLWRDRRGNVLHSSFGNVSEQEFSSAYNKFMAA